MNGADQQLDIMATVVELVLTLFRPCIEVGGTPCQFPRSSVPCGLRARTPAGKRSPRRVNRPGNYPASRDPLIRSKLVISTALPSRG